MYVVKDTAVVLGVLGAKSNFVYDTAKQQSSRRVQPYQLAYTLGCRVLYYNPATSESLVNHNRTPARFVPSTRGTLRTAKPIVEVIEILTSVKRSKYSFELILPTR